MQNISVLTLVQNRNDALSNTIKGLKRNSLLPAELIVIHMNEKVTSYPEAPFPIRPMTCLAQEKLPLAKARNMALAQSTTLHNIFLDVDCIPDSTLIAKYKQAFDEADVLWSGKVNYLPSDFDFTKEVNLRKRAKPDPIRAALKHYSYELFWSLNFGCSKTIFETIGGFDEQFVGYGAEDTDFAFKARATSVPLKTVDAFAYHQYHQAYDPPLNHLTDIVTNAQYFYRKWKQWPMKGWLKKFSDAGYITLEGNNITLNKYPSEEQLNEVLK